MTTTLASPEAITAAAEADFEPVALSEEAAADLRARLAASKTGRTLWPVNPRHVDVRRNVRNLADPDQDDAKIDPEFVASVKERLLQLPTAFLLPDNTISIADGQRRTLAARSAGLAEIDYVISLPDENEARQRAAELVGGVKANKERQDLTDEHLYNAQEELAGLDLPTKVRNKALKELGIGANDAKALRSLRGTRRARETAISGELDLIQAAEAVEFEDDPKAMARLINAAHWNRFGAELAGLCEERRVRGIIAEAVAPYAERGFQIMSRPPHNDEERKQFVAIEDLRTPEGREVTEADIAASQWAVCFHLVDRTVDILTGEPVADDRIDQDTYQDPTRQAADGLYHAEQVRTTEHAQVSYYCIDIKRAGLRKAKPAVSGSSAAASAELNAKAISILNKQAKLETIKRRTFVADWLSKTPRTVPAEVQMWRVRLEAAAPEIFKEYTARSTAAALLNWTESKIKDGSVFDGASLARAQMIAIGLGMGAIEGRMHPREDKPSYWRITVPQAGVFWTVDMYLSRPYLRQLIALGHAPGIVERLTLDEITPAQALEAIANGTDAADIPAAADNADEHQAADGTEGTQEHQAAEDGPDPQPVED